MRRVVWALALAGTMMAGAGVVVAGAPSDGQTQTTRIAPTADSPGLWCFRPARREKEAAYEKALVEAVSPASLRTFHDHLASEPHVAGSEGDLRQIEYLRDAFEKMGLEVEVQWIDVYLAKPIAGEVEIVERDGKPASDSLPVKERPVDEASADPRVDIGWNAYSGSGEVTGEVVYANYGTKEDFEKLRELGVDCTGKIVLARYGGNFRGYKAKFAQEAGAAGLIIYNDPEDVGYVKGLMYPEGGWANETQIQRGAIATYPYPGDPLTPGEPAIEGTKRLTPSEVELPRIPVQPVGWVAAKPILDAMRGPIVPEAWQGGLDVNYRVEGGEGLRVRLKVEQERTLMRTANVVGTLLGADASKLASLRKAQRDGYEGHLKKIVEARATGGEDASTLDVEESRLREQLEGLKDDAYERPFVVVGCHHDAWVNGAADPTCGLIVVLEMARTLSELAAKGERPDRTICFAAWGAEEFGIIGSTEWVEQHAQDLSQNCIAYLNLDMAAMGTNFGASASPLLKSLIADATRDVEQPDQTGTSVHDAWAARDEGRTPEQQIGSLGGGSDHVGFYCRLGIPSMAMGAGGSKGVSYHSAYDDLAWYRKVVGDDYASAAMITRIADIAVARLANADVLPFDVSLFGESLEEDLRSLSHRAQGAGVRIPWEGQLLEAAHRLASTGRDFRDILEQMLADPNRFNVTMIVDGQRIPNAECQWVNGSLTQFSRWWIDPDLGLLGRPWFRNPFVAPDPTSGYGSWPLPDLRLYVEEHHGDSAEHVQAMEREIDARAHLMVLGLNKASTEFETIRNQLLQTPAPADRP